MSLEILEERVNPLLGRRDVRLIINHSGAGTPDRLTVRNLASQHYKAGVGQVYVRSISTRTGGSSAICKVEVYDRPELAERNTPDFIKNRNLPKDQRKTKKEAEPGSAPTPAAAPKPAAPPPKPEAQPKPAPPSVSPPPQPQKPAPKK